MSNLEVAQYLLQHGLEGLDGVLFLNERNERVDLASAGGHMGPLPLGITWDHLGSLDMAGGVGARQHEDYRAGRVLGVSWGGSGGMLFSKFSNYSPYQEFELNSDEAWHWE